MPIVRYGDTRLVVFIYDGSCDSKSDFLKCVLDTKGGSDSGTQSDLFEFSRTQGYTLLQLA